ncbi:metal tolerance protein 3-like [Lotus japonicus]|uniref:metal tolerance protein 3-like n=1 Tax=Lotus japonicus TaxID=34305 RepID=UPI002588028A|nr:metal tolerance protein 3-like [Lotus japonicus]
MSDFMDGNSGPDPTKKPLLFKNGGSTTKNGRRGGLSPRNSYKSAFLSMLPDKVRSGFVTDEPPLSQGEKEYYETQLATLKSFEEVDSMEESEFDSSIVEEESGEQAQQERAMKISNYANIALLALKLRQSSGTYQWGWFRKNSGLIVGKFAGN